MEPGTVSGIYSGYKGWASILIHKGYNDPTKILAMSSLISVDEEQRIAWVDETCSMGAFWDPDALAVSGDQETDSKSSTASARQAWWTLSAWISNSAV